MRKLKKKIFYMAHTFSIREKVRDILSKELRDAGIETINPFYEENGKPRPRREEVAIADKEGKTLRFYRIIRKKAKNIVESDLELIRQAVEQGGGLIAFVEKPTIGTSMEIFYAGRMLQAPVFVLSYNKEIINHPWINTCAYKVVPSIKQLIREINKLYRRDNKR